MDVSSLTCYQILTGGVDGKKNQLIKNLHYAFIGGCNTDGIYL